MQLFPVGHASHPQWRDAADEVLAQLRQQMTQPGYARLPRLGLVYFSHEYAEQAQPLLAYLAHSLPGITDWAGCSAGGVLAMSREYAASPALAVMLLDLPAAHYRLYSGVAPLPTMGGEAGFDAEVALVHTEAGQPELAELLQELSERTRLGGLFGGVGGEYGDGVQIACRSEDIPALRSGSQAGIFSGGLTGVAFSADVACMTRMAQGCAPLSSGLEITAAQGQLVTGLEGDPALQRLLDVLGVSLDGDLQPALEVVRSTLVAIAPPGRGLEHGVLTGEAQVLSLVGLDPVRQGVALSAAVEAGDSVIFCRRQSSVARAELMQIGSALREELAPMDEAEAVQQQAGGHSPLDHGAQVLPSQAMAARQICGAVYISCEGRKGLFGEADAELKILRHALGDVPLIGFVAEAEIMDARLHRFAGLLTVFTAPA